MQRKCIIKSTFNFNIRKKNKEEEANFRENKHEGYNLDGILLYISLTSYKIPPKKKEEMNREKNEWEYSST